MWKELRERLDRLSLSTRRLRVEGKIELPSGDHECSLSIVINGELARTRGIAANGRFRLDLPADERVRLVFVSTGHLPRIVEVRPSPASDGTAQRLHLHVTLTPNGLFGGARMAPLHERITLGHGAGPNVVEYDREPTVQNDEYDGNWPLLKRAS